MSVSECVCVCVCVCVCARWGQAGRQRLHAHLLAYHPCIHTRVCPPHKTHLAAASEVACKQRVVGAGVGYAHGRRDAHLPRQTLV